MQTNKIIYWIATLLFCGIMLYSATFYFTSTQMVKGFFKSLQYPTYLVIPLAVAKLLAVVAILSKKSVLLKEWAYAGLFFDVALALVAHISAGDGGYLFAILALIGIIVSRLMDHKINATK